MLQIILINEIYVLELHHLDSSVEIFADGFETNEWHGGAFKKRSQSNYQMQCDIVPCLLWKTSLCNVFIQIIISICNYIYLLMIFHKFKVISLSFESPFMHIKHLKCSHQLMFLNSNILFVYQMSTIHSQSLRFILIIKSAKGVEINKKNLFITHIYTFGSNVF